jgi:L-threonylcarbamoyladenylate synthase
LQPQASHLQPQASHLQPQACRSAAKGLDSTKFAWSGGRYGSELRWAQMIERATDDCIGRAATLLSEGLLVAFPTETVYGLGADAGNADALRRLYAAKGRPGEHPVIVHMARASMMPRWARIVPPIAQTLADAFWPGPLTLVVPRAEHVSTLITGGQDSVGLRVPAHPVAHALLERFAVLGGEGIAAPSANRFGRVSATLAQHVADEFGSEVSLILDGGACDHGIESTIVDCTRRHPVLLRPGAIAAARIARVIGAVPDAAGPDAPRASGTLESHYAPRTPSYLMARDELRARVAGLDTASSAHIAVLAHSLSPIPSFAGHWRAAAQDAVAYAHDLYANLRALDASGALELWIERAAAAPEWDAIADRLRRATHRT